MQLPKLKAVKTKRTKKKILLLSDDIRLKSGVGTMSKEMVTGTAHKFDWIQMGGALNHPDAGKGWVDLSEAVNKEQGIDNASVKVLPVAGYGDSNILRQVINREKPDAIMHFTDPRFWGWLYNMENEIRQNIPLTYLNIWDDLPFPHWNENAYESCDLLMAISKQTYNINKNVCQRKPRVEGKDLTYVQHGINEKEFFPIEEDAEFETFKNNLLGFRDFDFIAFYNSRNIRRKSPGDLILSWGKFCESLPKEKADNCLLIMHTDPVDDNGTDLPAVHRALCPDTNVMFSATKVDTKQLNYLYNIADVVCNPSSAEGFGLSHMEALMSGTPTIATVLGGLQDQMGFKVNGEELNVKHLTDKIPSNSTGDLSTEHGSWTLPLWPQLNLQGSPMTPYIYDSRSSISQIKNALEVWYNRGNEDRKKRGLEGRKWAIENKFTKKGMCDALINSLETCMENFKPSKRYTLTKVGEMNIKYPKGELL